MSIVESNILFRGEEYRSVFRFFKLIESVFHCPVIHLERFPVCINGFRVTEPLSEVFRLRSLLGPFFFRIGEDGRDLLFRHRAGQHGTDPCEGGHIRQGDEFLLVIIRQVGIVHHGTGNEVAADGQSRHSGSVRL